MKSLLPVVWFALLASKALSQEAIDLAVPHITVTGTAVTEVTPDRLLWSALLKNTGPELPAVADTHAALMARLLQALKELGIEASSVQTSQMEFGENRVYRNQEQVKEGYFASTQVSFKLGDLGKYKTVWMRLAGISELSVTNVSFDHSNSVEIRKETRRKALLAAKEKANAMTEVLETKTGEVLSIREEGEVTPLYAGNRISPNVMSSAMGQDGAGGDPLAPGTIPIRSSVIVTFKLQGAAK